MEIKIKNNWDDLSWKEYEQLDQILNANIPQAFKTVNIISLLSGVSVEELENLPIIEFQRLLPEINFIDTKPNLRSHQTEYIVNGREYSFVGNVDEITTSQYIDYRSYMNEEVKDVANLMSVFLIPKGHKYNDGYDINQVKSDIGDMCWLDVRAAAFFFRIWLGEYILILKYSLIKELRRLKKEKKKEESKKLAQQIKQVEEYFNSSVSSLLSSKFVNIQTPHSM